MYINFIDVIEAVLTAIVMATVAIIVVICSIFVVPWVFQVYWNFTMTYLFGLPEIAYWQSFAIYIITVIFVKIKR